MYRTAYFCVACNKELTWHSKMYCNGRCPKCGFKGESAGTIVDCDERAYRGQWVWTGRLWPIIRYDRDFNVEIPTIVRK